MVFAVEEQDPNEIEFFEFTLPGVYEQKVDEHGRLVFEEFKSTVLAEGDLPEYDPTSKPVFTKKLEIHRLPKMQFLGVAMVEQIESTGIVGVMQVFGGNANAIRRLNGKQLGSLMSAWRAASAVGLGESEA